MGKGDFRACIRCLSEIKSVDGRWDMEEGFFPCVQEYGNENILVGKMAGAGHCFGIYVQSSYRYKSIYSSRIRLENKDENSLLAKIIR